MVRRTVVRFADGVRSAPLPVLDNAQEQVFDGIGPLGKARDAGWKVALDLDGC